MKRISPQLVSINDISVETINDLLLKSGSYLSDKKNHLPKPKKIALYFAEASTRTRLSFILAAKSLGAEIIDCSHWQLSLTRGEDLEDFIKTISFLGVTALIIRIPYQISDQIKAIASSQSLTIINAGDGENEHPTQALIDWFTISNNYKKIDRINIALMGDLKSHRSAHSLLLLLRKFNKTVTLITPPKLEAPDNLNRFNKTLKWGGDIQFEKFDIIIIYPFIPKNETEYKVLFGANWQKIRSILNINKSDLNEKINIKIMHPFPRHGELDPEIDGSKHDLYSYQMKYAVPVRKAIIKHFIIR